MTPILGRNIRPRNCLKLSERKFPTSNVHDCFHAFVCARAYLYVLACSRVTAYKSNQIESNHFYFESVSI